MSNVLPTGIGSEEALGTPVVSSGYPLLQIQGIESEEQVGYPAIFRRISGALGLAQAFKTRETGLEIKVVDEQVNQWEYVAGKTIPESFYADGVYEPVDIEYQEYRGTAGMCKLDNGNIIRVRNGSDEDETDRQIWIQTITDPTDDSQWEVWSVLYSGTHYGVSIQPNGASYVVYHAKSDGIYRNNVLKWTPSSGKAIGFVPVRGQLGAGWVKVIVQDPYGVTGDVVMDLYYTSDLNSVTPTADENNYRWPKLEVTGIKDTATGKVYRICAGNLYFGSRDETHGRTVWQQNQPSYTNQTLTAPYPIRGIGGGSGLNFIKGQQIVKLSDGFYYLFMTESRVQELLDNVAAFTQLWSTTNVPKPEGCWYDSGDPTHLKIGSRDQKKIYTILLSDRSVTATTPVLTTYDIHDISGDPADNTIYWVLETPWSDGVDNVKSKIRKFRKSDNALLATYPLSTDKWTALKASSDHLWLANKTTDKIYKYSKSGTLLKSYAIYYGGVRQINPVGILVVSKTLFYIFANSTRILKATEGHPTVITHKISTHKIAIQRGDFNDTGTVLYATHDSSGKTYGFDLIADRVIPLPEGGANIGDLQLWIRSKDLFHWSAPVVGPGITDPRPIAGVEESGGYAYWSDNGSVWRRPMTPNVVDLTNYVTDVDFEVPRDNQGGTGQITVANPAGINDGVIDLADKDLTLKLGIRNQYGIFEFAEFNRWWLKRASRKIEGATNRLSLKLVDLWDRISGPLQDVYNVVGKLEWDDWSSGKTNQIYNYYFGKDTSPEVVGNRLRTFGFALFTGWKGHNPDLSVKFSNYTGTVSLLARYTNSQNFIRIKKNYDTVYLYEQSAGVSTLITSALIRSAIPNYSPSNSDTITLRVVLKWRKYWIYVNGTLLISGSRTWKLSEPGYAGATSSSDSYDISNFSLDDWEYNVTIGDLIRTTLALGDVHDITVTTTATDKAYAIVWGPQTDMPTAADALRQFCESLKLQVAYRGGVITIDKFTDDVPLYTFQDTVIDTDQLEESDQRTNWVAVDGNENYWLEVDVNDTRSRGRQNVAYFDLPELLTLETVKARAQEELRRAVEARNPGGTIILPFDLWRMDPITWIDNVGNSYDVRVEGIKVQVSQGRKPFQRMHLDTSLLADTVDG